MGFFFRRYLESLKQHWPLLFLAILPAAIYLLSQAFLHKTFTVSQEISYVGNVQVAKNPVETLSLDQIIEDPHRLFQEEFALAQLNKNVILFQRLGTSELSEVDLRRLIDSSMSLSKANESAIELQYRGDNEQLGRFMVEFFSERLAKRAENAKRRPQGAAAPGARLAPASTVEVEAARVFWDAKRLRPAALVLLVGLLVILAAIAVSEMLDTSFKSDRQIARYLGLPILGNIPNAAPLTKRLEHEVQD